MDAPLAEESEAYRVTIGAQGVERSVDTTSPQIRLTAADLAGGAICVTISQRGTFGESRVACLAIPA